MISVFDSQGFLTDIFQCVCYDRIHASMLRAFDDVMHWQDVQCVKYIVFVCCPEGNVAIISIFPELSCNIYAILIIKDHIQHDYIVPLTVCYIVNMDEIKDASDHFEMISGDIVPIRQREAAKIRNLYKNYIENFE